MPSAAGNPTIYSVAARAGVSISTVSLALNHPHRVSAPTRRKVAEAAEAEGYRARTRGGSARGGLRTIVVAAPFSSYPSYYRRLDGIIERCSSDGIEVVVHDLPAANTQAAPILDALPIRDDLDGVIVMGTPVSAEVQVALQRSMRPLVLVDAHVAGVPSVIADDEYGGGLLGAHLAGQGHRRIIFAHDGQVSLSYVSAGMRRLEGLTRALQESGGDVIEHFVDDHVVAKALEAGATAIVCSNDSVAGRVHRMLLTAGVRVGEGLALTGYDGLEIAEALDLTTVAQPFVDSGRIAADLIVGLLAGTSPVVLTITLTGTLVVRASSASPVGA